MITDDEDGAPAAPANSPTPEKVVADLFEGLRKSGVPEMHMQVAEQLLDAPVPNRALVAALAIQNVVTEKLALAIAVAASGDEDKTKAELKSMLNIMKRQRDFSVDIVHSLLFPTVKMNDDGGETSDD